MSIDNISRIYEKNVECTYLFDVKESKEEDATVSYILRCDKRHNDPSLEKITDYTEIINHLNRIKAKAVEEKSKECSRFMTYLGEYIKKYQYDRLMEEEIEDNITDNDIKVITKELRYELKRCKK